MILTVDLASKMSAACVMGDSASNRSGENGKVYSEFDSYGKTAFQFARELKVAADTWEVDLIVLEDVPYGISSQAMVKPVLRLQGVLILALSQHLDKILFLNPSSWQKYYPGVARGEAKARVEAARQAALSLGYSPPDKVQEYIDSLPEGSKVLKKNTNPLEKVMTDYIDAFLMARWVLSVDDIRNISGVQPVSI